MTEQREARSRGPMARLVVGVVLALALIGAALFLATRDNEPAAADPSASAVAGSSSPSSGPSATSSEPTPSASASESTEPAASPSVAEAVPATPGEPTLTWVEGAPISGTVYTAAWMDDRWLIGGGSAGRAAVWESADASAWSAAPPIEPAPVAANDETGPSAHWISAFADWEGTLVGAGVHRFGRGDGLTMAMWTSPDGRTWEHIDLAHVDQGGTYPTAAVAPDARLIIIGVGNLGTQTFLYSTTDGESWEGSELTGANEVLSDIAGGPPSLIGVGQAYEQTAENPFAYASTIWASPDWVTWDPVVTGPPGYLSAAAYDHANGRFVAGGTHVDPAVDPNGSPVVWLSDNGRAWSPVMIDPGVGSVRDVAVANGVILAVGSLGDAGGLVLWESRDGVAWAATPFPAGTSGTPHLVANDDRALVLISTCCEVEETLVWSAAISP